MFESISTGAVLAQAAESPPFFQSGMFLFLLLIAAVALGWFLAGAIAKSLNVADYSSRMATVAITVFIAGLMIWSGWPPKFGVDLRGGINMIGSLNTDSQIEDGGRVVEAEDIIRTLKARVDPTGVHEIMIRALGKDKIEVTVPSVDKQVADDIWERLVKAGKLEFRILANPVDFPNEVELARQMAEDGGRGRPVKGLDSDGNPKTMAVWVALARRVYPDNNPPKIIPFKFVPDTRAHLVRDKSTGRILNLGDVQYSSVQDNNGLDLARWADANGYRTLQILVIQPDEDQLVDGKHLTGAQPGMDQKTGKGTIQFDMTSKGSIRMGMLTSMNIGQPMGIVLDGQLHSAPNIETTIYKNGRIVGDFTPEEVTELVNNLKSGRLEVALNKEPISQDFIESTLGKELKEKGIWAIGCSLLLVLVFMLVYYRFSGVVATIALLLNLFLILALIMAIQQPLTLTGLAGVVLVVGMSVDANVLIFERIREEIDRGAALRMAIRNGFDKATTTIVDANVTTLITALVLYVIGTEQIKGFSVTLFFGILISMFTAIFVSRIIFDVCERQRWVTKLNMTRILDRGSWNFLNKVRVTGVISAILIVVGIGAVYLLGPRILSHDLRGGSTVRMVFNQPQDAEEIRDRLKAENIMHEGGNVAFDVSGYGDTGENLRFKVDSSLPAWEGEQSGQERFEQLDEILSRVFAGELQLFHVSITGMAAPVVNGENEAGPAVDSKPAEEPKIGMKWESSPATASFSALTTSLLTYQDDSTQDDSTQDDSTQDDSTQVDSAQDGEGDEPSKAIANAPEPVVMVNVVREVALDPPVSGKTLVALLVDASRRADAEIDEDQIKVNTSGVKDDESVETTVSDKWTVTLEVAKESEGDLILTTWSERFNITPYFPTVSKVGGQIAGQTQIQALAAIFASLLGIIAYVWIRFQNVAFGLAAVIALIHDVLIVLGAIAISHYVAQWLGFLGIVEFKISLEIVAALLTVIGYSLNDTIVVFDRIREVRGKRTEITAEMINTSISQTLSRTILTSVTTFIVVFILYWFGGEAIHGFAFALVVGVVVGTYSSIFIASPALLWLMNTVGLNPGEVDPATE